MRSMLHLITIMIVILSIATQSIAADLCSPVQTAVYFGNGVGRGIATFGDAIDGRDSLQMAVSPSLSSEEQAKYIYKLAFNRSAETDNEFLARVNDIVEVARQTFGNEWPRILLAFFLRDNWLLNLMIPADVQQQFNDFLNNQTAQQFLAGSQSTSDVSSHVTSYKSDIQEGKKIVLVSHSQGNIFANLSYQQLNATESQYFTIVPVASPESYCRKSLVGHVRFWDDAVINGVMALKLLAGIPTPLAANDQDSVDEDPLSHEFVNAYLKDDSSKQFIINGVINSNSSLPNPPGTSGQGTITITLTWGSNPDVDLHTYEPTGRHVYYGARSGQFGYLDVDDTSGYGPEHYYVSCQALRDNPAAVGRYRFGVNYYYGYSPEVATVTVKTPSSEHTASKTLTSWDYNRSFVPMADVVVSKNPDTGHFDFVIEPK